MENSSSSFLKAITVSVILTHWVEWRRIDLAFQKQLLYRLFQSHWVDGMYVDPIFTVDYKSTCFFG